MVKMPACNFKVSRFELYSRLQSSLHFTTKTNLFPSAKVWTLLLFFFYKDGFGIKQQRNQTLEYADFISWKEPCISNIYIYI